MILNPPKCLPEYELTEGLLNDLLTAAYHEKVLPCSQRSQELSRICFFSSNADQVRCNMTRQAACGERCIPVAWLCNGERECPDGTDELGEKFEARYAVQVFLISDMLLIRRVEALDLDQREGVISGPHLAVSIKCMFGHMIFTKFLIKC